MGVVIALALKDARLLLADKLGFFFVFVWPLMFALFFGFVTARVFSADRAPLAMFVLDEDQTDASAAMMQSLRDDPGIAVIIADALASAERAVMDGEAAALLVIPSGLGEAVTQPLVNPAAELRLIVDPARPIEAGAIEGAVRGAAFAQLEQPLRRLATLARRLVGSNEAITVESGGAPITLRRRDASAASSGPVANRVTSWHIVIPQSVVWGMMACAAVFAQLLVYERLRGALPRLLAAPIHAGQILAAKALACVCLTTFVAVAALALAALLVDVRPANMPGVAAAVLCTSIAVVGLMMLLAGIGRSEAATAGGSWAAVVVMAMLGGGMIPLSQLEGVLGRVSYVSIFRWAILALEGAVWRQFSAAQLAQPCLVLLGIGFGGFGLGLLLMRRGWLR